MPAKTDPMLRVARATYESVRRIAVKAPPFNVSTLADTLLREACAAAEGGSGTELPTVLYLRTVFGLPTSGNDIEARLSRIEQSLPPLYANAPRPPALRVAEEPTKPARKKSA